MTSAAFPMRTLKTARIARTLGISKGRLERLVSLTGGRGTGNTFQNLVLVRTLMTLTEDASTREVRRAVDGISERLGDDALTRVTLRVVAGRVIAYDDGRAWEAVTGQLRLDLDPPAATSGITRLTLPTPVAADRRYEQAWELEDTEPARSTALYREALELDPEHANAAVNLVRLYHEQGDMRRALESYQIAITLRDDDPTAWFNRGVALTDMNKLSAALLAYKAATAADPRLADAYFNAAAVCERLGKKQEAMQLLQRYRALTR